MKDTINNPQEGTNGYFATVDMTSLNDLFDITHPFANASKTLDNISQIIIEPNRLAYRYISKEKVNKMLYIGQTKVKKMLRKLAKNGSLLALLYGKLLNVLTSYLCMLRYMCSHSRYGNAYARVYHDAINKFLEVSCCSDNQFNVEIYKIENSIQFSHIVIVELIGIGKMAFCADLQIEQCRLINRLPGEISLDPVNYYHMIETAIMTEFSSDIYDKCSEISIARKNRLDTETSIMGLTSIHNYDIDGLLARYKNIKLKNNEMSYCSPLLYLYNQRKKILEPGATLPKLTVQTNNEFVCVGIRLDSVELADAFLKAVHGKLCRYSWYLWSESNNIDPTCFVLCYRHQLSESKSEYIVFESLVLSKIGTVISDLLNCRINELFSECISIEKSYTPAYGPMLINLEFGIESQSVIKSSKGYIDSIVNSGELNSNVLQALDRQWLLDECNETLCIKENRYLAETCCTENDLLFNDILDSIGHKCENKPVFPTSIVDNEFDIEIFFDQLVSNNEKKSSLPTSMDENEPCQKVLFDESVYRYKSLPNVCHLGKTKEIENDEAFLACYDNLSFVAGITICDFILKRKDQLTFFANRPLLEGKHCGLSLYHIFNVKIHKISCCFSGVSPPSNASL